MPKQDLMDGELFNPQSQSNRTSNSLDEDNQGDHIKNQAKVGSKREADDSSRSNQSKENNRVRPRISSSWVQSTSPTNQ